MCVIKVTEDAVPVGARGAITARLVPLMQVCSARGDQPGSWPLGDGHPAACCRHPPGGPGRPVSPRLQRKLAGKHIFYCFSCPGLSSLRLPRGSWNHFPNKLMAPERAHNKTESQTGSGVLGEVPQSHGCEPQDLPPLCVDVWTRGHGAPASEPGTPGPSHPQPEPPQGCTLGSTCP